MMAGFQEALNRAVRTMAKFQERILTGDKALDRKLKFLERKAANRASRAGLGRGARVAAKAIKQEIPSSAKGIRRSIGSYVKKASRGAARGITEAKAGFSVGSAAKRAASIEKNRGGKPGVGISTQNVHWWVLGTEREKTGSTEPHDIVKPAVTGAMSAIKSAIREGVKASLMRAAKKKV